MSNFCVNFKEFVTLIHAWDIRENDIILKINGEEILKSEEMKHVLQNLELPFEVTLLQARANLPVLDVFNWGNLYLIL